MRAGIGLAAAGLAVVLLTLAWLCWLEVDAPGGPAPAGDPFAGELAAWRRVLHDGTR